MNFWFVKSWTVFSNSHEDSNALFNIISSQDILLKLNIWYMLRKKKIKKKLKWKGHVLECMFCDKNLNVLLGVYSKTFLLGAIVLTLV